MGQPSGTPRASSPLSGVTDFDVLVLGGGSAGYAAARVAAGKGVRVGLVERGPVAGLCILDGCIPSKALTVTSDLLHRMRTARALGLHATDIRADFAQVMARKRRLVREYAAFRRNLIAETDGVELLLGNARFTGSREIALQPTHPDGSTNLSAPERHLTARAFVLATGSYAWVPPIPGLEMAGYVTSDAALDFDAPPASMVVLGAGLIALELGQFYARMGTHITLLHRGDRVLSRGDPDVSEAIARRLREEHIDLQTDVTVERCSRREDGTRVVTAAVGGESREFAAEIILVALGRRAQIHGLNLAAAGITLDEEDCFVTVDDALRTSNPHVYAAGDVAMRHQMTHVAVQQGEVAGANAAGGERRLDSALEPQVIFCDPPFARVGLDEQAAREAGVEVDVARYEFADHAMAELMGQTTGFVKLLAAREDGRIVGVQIFGHQADTLIHEAVVAMRFGATAAQLAAIPHFHPTLSEILPACAERIPRVA